MKYKMLSNGNFDIVLLYCIYSFYPRVIAKGYTRFHTGRFRDLVYEGGGEKEKKGKERKL